MSEPLQTALDAAEIERHLGSLRATFAVRLLDSCTSTNSLLLEAPPPDDGRVHILACERQSAGRGRRGREWLSWSEASLTFSMLWRFPAGAPVPAGLSLVAGLAVARTVEKLGATDVQLKWPNDVLVAGGKLAGILVELSSGRDKGTAAVIGVGMNLSLPPGASVPGQVAVADLHRVLPALPDRNRLLALLLIEFAALLETYAAAGFPALREAWQQRNAHADQAVRVTGEGGDIEGRCLGVDHDGALLLATGGGTRRVLSGEVSLRPLA